MFPVDFQPETQLKIQWGVAEMCSTPFFLQSFSGGKNPLVLSCSENSGERCNMLEDACIAECIFYDFPLRDIMHRLGGSLDNSEQVALVSPIARRFYETVRAKGAYGTLEIVHNDGKRVTFADGSTILSSSIARFCSSASMVWLAAVTLGNVSAVQIESAISSQNASFALILDAAASECADAALQSLQNLARQEMRRKGLLLSVSRFSCGYGDWNLSDQSLYFKWLPMERLGILLTDGGIMIPEKSITALSVCERTAVPSGCV